MAVAEEQYRQDAAVSPEPPSRKHGDGAGFNLSILPNSLQSAARRLIAASALLMVVSWGSLAYVCVELQARRNLPDFFVMYLFLFMAPIIIQGQLVLGWLRSERSRNQALQLLQVNIATILLLFCAALGPALGSSLIQHSIVWGSPEQRETSAMQAISESSFAGMIVPVLFAATLVFSMSKQKAEVDSKQVSL